MTKDDNEKEILREYYSFLYDLASKKNYLHESQLSDEEKKYCDKLLSRCKTNVQQNEMDMPLMKNILLRHYGLTGG
jgi:hypothetical protein